MSKQNKNTNEKRIRLVWEKNSGNKAIQKTNDLK